MKISLYLFIIIFIIVSCNKQKITPLIVDKSLTLTKEKKITNYGYGSGLLKDSLLIFIAYTDPAEKFIHIYDTSFNFKIRTGNKGKLFSEFNMPEFYNSNSVNPIDSIIHLYDINLLHDKYFKVKDFLSDTNANEQIHGQFFPTQLYFSNNLNLLNDSTIIGQNIDENKGIYFIFQKDQKEVKWIKFNHHYKYPNKRYQSSAYLNSICTNPMQNKILIAYRFFDLIQLYDEKGNLLKEISFSKIQKPLLATNYSGISPNTPYFYLSIYGTSQYCYILRANKTGHELQEDKSDTSGELIVMDWSGNIKNIYHVPTLLYSITVNEPGTVLYATIKDFIDPEYAYIQKYDL